MKKLITLLLLLITFTVTTSYCKISANETDFAVVLKSINEFSSLEKDEELLINIFEAPKYYFGTENLHYGDYGSIRVGSYNAGLYGDERRYNTTLDKYIDMEYAAPVYTLYSGIVYIPDHNYQGFTEILEEDTLYIHDLHGRPTEYHKLSTHYCYDFINWICTDGIDAFYDSRGADLVTQTCIPGGVVFVYWTIAE